MFKLLILDDGGGGNRSKGYPNIETWYPGIFGVTVCLSIGIERNGMIGRRLLEYEKWDVILLDCQFDPPDSMDGTDALRMIRKVGHTNSQTWVIGCSSSWKPPPPHWGKDSPPMKELKAKLNGVSDNPEELKQCLSEFLTHQTQI